MSIQLAVIIPTLNEVGNIEPLLQRLDIALTGIEHHIIFVDDNSRDGTTELLRKLSQQRPNVRFIHRIGRRGLSSACTEGMLSTAAPFLAVMDADLQHDESLLPKMYDRVRQGDLDIMVASRFAKGADLGNFANNRQAISHTGIKLSQYLTKANLTDPLSGFFMLRRELLDEVVHNLSAQGFKILLDIFTSAGRPLKFEEVPLRFGERHSGESKLDTLVMLEFLMLLGDKTIGRWLPLRFILFIMVGLVGMGVHLVILATAFRMLGMSFYNAQILATVVAMLGNYHFNNQFTYRDLRLKGRKYWMGLLSFILACSLGALINLTIASYLYEQTIPWAMAGVLGAVVGSVWNYGVTSALTWRAHARK
ncbi:MAG: glycosyltransferase family 2 protein [Phycisphaerales bacterium]|nr:glycosyltransferase family 2 protein [Phycisphaerales bacterium]